MTEEIDPEVDLLFAALDEAKNRYETGVYVGHCYQLGGVYSSAAFERFRTLAEDCWRLCYIADQRTVLLFGDPSIPHQHCSRYLSSLIMRQLQECLRRAPSTGVPLRDRFLVNTDFDPRLFFDELGAVLHDLQEDSDHPFILNRPPGPIIQQRSGLVKKEVDFTISVKTGDHYVPLVLGEVGYKSESYTDVISSVWLEHFAAPLVIGVKASVS
jgi:hypothetical protein